MASDALGIVSFKCVVKGYQKCRFDVKDGDVFNGVKENRQDSPCIPNWKRARTISQFGHDHLQRVLFCSLKCRGQFINGVSVIRINCKNAQEKPECFDGLALGLLCIGLPELIERNPFDCVRLSSVSEPNRTQSDGLSSIEFDFFD